jgi:hypothetical protein
MTSSRDFPFSFSPDLRLSLGAPDGLNVALRFAFPCLFSESYAPTRAALSVLVAGSRPRLEIRPGACVPAGTLVGLFPGHIFSATAPEARAPSPSRPRPRAPVPGTWPWTGRRGRPASPPRWRRRSTSTLVRPPRSPARGGMRARCHASSRTRPATSARGTACPGILTPARRGATRRLTQRPGPGGRPAAARCAAAATPQETAPGIVSSASRRIRVPERTRPRPDLGPAGPAAGVRNCFSSRRRARCRRAEQFSSRRCYQPPSPGDPPPCPSTCPPPSSPPPFPPPRCGRPWVAHPRRGGAAGAAQVGGGGRLIFT